MPAPDDFSREPEKPLFALLDRLGIQTTTYTHAKVFTVAESENVKVDMPGGHTKNLFMEDKSGQLVLVCALGSSVLALNQLHRQIRTQRLSFTDAPLLWEALGVTPGSVTGFAILNDTAQRIRLVLDEALLAHETLNFHPLRCDMTTAISRADFLGFAEATGHTVTRIDFTKLGAS
ncbi:MAG: prolyl-tRNA synthetase associated domain-containing protein [Hyphomonadaceae bacterium]